MLGLLLLLAWGWYARPGKTSESGEKSFTWDRNARLIYTHHARCRMDCRHITEEEVREILTEGEVNKAKSNPADRPCPTYALEGYSHEGQHLRIVFAPCDEGTRVVTCIDLDKDWACSCE
jgi:hypothetical protein